MAKILIIDDDYSVRSMFQFLLEDEGYEIKLATNGQAALDCILDFIPDLMLIDINMPVMSGPEFLKGLKGLTFDHPELENIPYIVLTSENIVEAEKEFGFQKTSLCQQFLPKNTEHDIVLSLVAKILKGKN